ncbi:hypothetical protein ACFWWC_26685 [Streptomyces sp. NPDC058642]|uniref:hypothetical protein n=1 Tax=Streptomyces sp. NPDC058642 TaxID=3346572 RepID=UPI003654F5B9
MTEHTAPWWAQRIGAAERAVRGEPGSLDDLRAHLATLADVQGLLHSPDDAQQFAYLVTLLRELDLAEELAVALDLAAEWIHASRVGLQYRCVVHNRLAAVLIDEGGAYLDDALTALESALDAADTPVEKAHTHTNLALCAAAQGKWRAAESHARQGNELGRSLPESGPHLDVLLRTTSVLFLSAGRAEDDARVRRLAHDLEELCQQQMDRLGDDHPRSLEALVLMASARHETAVLDGDLTGMERLIDVLAVAAQRASTTLGLRHPQAKAVRKALAHTHETTARARAGLAAAARPSASERPASFTLVLELLVHGIEGATPERTLADPRVVQIAGDEIAALHRRAADADAEARPHDYQGRTIPETYSWGPLAPGRPGQVLWFLLLPFMLVNLAHWMRPPSRDQAQRTIRLHGLLIRLAALSLTVLVVTAVCELSMDLVAWQCAGQAACARSQSFWLGFLSAESGWWGQPGSRLAVGSLLPCALIYLLWRLSRQTWNAYESQQPLPHPQSETDDDQARRPPLSRPGFWYGSRLLDRLNSMHTTAGLATVALLLIAAPSRYDRQAGGPAALVLCGWLLSVLIAFFGLIAVWGVCRRGRSENRIDRQLDLAFTRAAPTGSAALVALSLLYATWSRPGWRSAGLLPSSELIYSGVLLAQGLIMVTLALVGTMLFRSAPAPHILLQGLAPATAVTLAFSLYNMMAAGAVQGLADWLGNYGRPGTAGGPIAGPPPLVTWQMSAIPVLLAVLLAQAGVLRLRLRRVERQLLAAVEADYRDERYDPLRTRRIATARARARITDSIPTMLGTMASAVLLLSVTTLVAAVVTDAPPGGTGLPQPLSELSQALKGIGSWLIAVGVVVFLNSSRRASRAPTSRSLLGIVWDLGTFWPRAAHPFARLSYSERAVPDLTWRMSTWCRMTGGRILVSAHSQGSVLAAAAIWQLPPSERRRIQLLTYGSPLERLYGRLFPAFLRAARATRTAPRSVRLAQSLAGYRSHRWPGVPHTTGAQTASRCSAEGSPHLRPERRAPIARADPWARRLRRRSSIRPRTRAHDGEGVPSAERPRAPPAARPYVGHAPEDATTTFQGAVTKFDTDGASRRIPDVLDADGATRGARSHVGRRTSRIPRLQSTSVHGQMQVMSKTSPPVPRLASDEVISTVMPPWTRSPG